MRDQWCTLDQLMIDCYQTGIKIVPTSEWTLEKKGAKQVEVTGLSTMVHR